MARSDYKHAVRDIFICDGSTRIFSLNSNISADFPLASDYDPALYEIIGVYIDGSIVAGTLVESDAVSDTVTLDSSVNVDSPKVIFIDYYTQIINSNSLVTGGASQIFARGLNEMITEMNKKSTWDVWDTEEPEMNWDDESDGPIANAADVTLTFASAVTDRYVCGFEVYVVRTGDVPADAIYCTLKSLTIGGTERLNNADGIIRLAEITPAAGTYLTGHIHYSFPLPASNTLVLTITNVCGWEATTMGARMQYLDFV